mmetsp:Transcript_1565/g.3244  ORF Transcript_1565/g.3244 Transcript_1565/m.3244 type:complete len:85 (-) Transcript_1565:844-1098(-)
MRERKKKGKSRHHVEMRRGVSGVSALQHPHHLPAMEPPEDPIQKGRRREIIEGTEERDRYLNIISSMESNRTRTGLPQAVAASR